MAEECAIRPMREEPTPIMVLTTVAGLLFVASGAGLVALVHRRSGLGRLGTAGAAFGALGVLVLSAGLLMQVVEPALVDGTMPFFVLSGGGALLVGLLLLGAVVMRSGILPRWVGVLLVVGALAMAGSNDQDIRVLLLTPLGAAWVLMGGVLLASATRRPAVAAPTTTG